MLRIFIVFFVALLLMSCSSTMGEVGPIVDTLRDGRYEEANGMLDDEIRENLLSKQGPIVLGLDVGMLAYYAGDHDASNRALSLAEEQIFEEYTQSMAADMATYIFNDNSKAYPGERYEDIYLNIFKALNYFNMDATESAMVEIRRCIEKIEELKKLYEIMSAQLYEAGEFYKSGLKEDENFETEFVSSALALYLGMVFSRGIGDIANYGYCERYIPSTYSGQPGIYGFDMPGFFDGEEYSYGQGKARLNFISFTGLAPYKDEYAEYIRLNQVSQQKFVYPVLVGQSSAIESVRVSIPEERISRTMELVEDFDTVIEDIFSVRQTVAMEKAYIRSRMKAGVADAAAEYFENSGDVRNDTSFEASLVFVLQGLATNTESADVRGSHFLPSKAWGYGVTLDEGVYDITVEFLDSRGRVVHSEYFEDYPVYSDKANLIDSFCLL